MVLVLTTRQHNIGSLTTRQHNIGSFTCNMQYILSMTYTFVKNERKKYTVLIHKYVNEHSISLIWKIRIFFSVIKVSHSAHLFKFEANGYLIIPQWKLLSLSDSPQIGGRLSLVPCVLERESQGFRDSSILTN